MFLCITYFVLPKHVAIWSLGHSKIFMCFLTIFYCPCEKLTNWISVKIVFQESLVTIFDNSVSLLRGDWWWLVEEVNQTCINCFYIYILYSSFSAFVWFIFSPTCMDLWNSWGWVSHSLASIACLYHCS